MGPERVEDRPCWGLVTLSQFGTIQWGALLRRLFSTFAHGWPGAGLLILRMVACGAVVTCGLRELRAVQPVEPAILEIAAIIAGALLFVGLWTPVAGCLVAAFELWTPITKSGDSWIDILVAAIGVALSMIGPGAWSIDARLFGWKRINVWDRGTWP